MKLWSIVACLFVMACTSWAIDVDNIPKTYSFSSDDVITISSCGWDGHCCKRGPHIVQVLSKHACKVAGTTVPGLLRDSGDKYYRDPGPPCDRSLTYERQAWSDWPECEGARQLK